MPTENSAKIRSKMTISNCRTRSGMDLPRRASMTLASFFWVRVVAENSARGIIGHFGGNTDRKVISKHGASGQN
jgi:hypothetical protein